jgi:hypothetical protein
MSSNSLSVPTEFVADAFETRLNESEEPQFIRAIDDTVSNLRVQIGDDQLEKMVRAGDHQECFRRLDKWYLMAASDLF